MVQSLAAYVKQELEGNFSLEEIRKKLLGKGFIEEDVDRAIYSVTKNIKYEKNVLHSRLNKVFSTKEVYDRIAYGFGNIQLVNILFSLTGASYFIIGLFNGLRSLLSTLFSGILKEYNKVHDMSKGFISILGMVFGFSFVLIAAAVRIKSVTLFAVALLVGAIGVVGHGDLYRKFLADNLSLDSRSRFLRKSSYYGVMITMVSMLMAGILLDIFPLDGSFVTPLFGQPMPILGYVIVFVLAAIMFILSGYVLTFIDDLRQRQKVPFWSFFADYKKQVKEHIKVFTKSKVIFLLFFATTLTGIVQVLGTSFYGIFIYDRFSAVALGGFLNVAVIFLIALLVSFVGPGITKLVSRHVGEAPMLVFGTLLIALLNLVMAFNPNLIAIGAAIALSTIGAAIVGVAQGLMALKLLRTEDRKQYFSALGFVMVWPFIIGIPLGSLVAQFWGLSNLFLILAIILVLIVAPMYFIIVLMSNKAELVA